MKKPRCARGCGKATSKKAQFCTKCGMPFAGGAARKAEQAYLRQEPTFWDRAMYGPDPAEREIAFKVLKGGLLTKGGRAA